MLHFSWVYQVICLHLGIIAYSYARTCTRRHPGGLPGAFCFALDAGLQMAAVLSTVAIGIIAYMKVIRLSLFVALPRAYDVCWE